MDAASLSAAAEATRHAIRASVHERAAREARAASARYRLAASTEARTAAVLQPLTASGWHLLLDRRWPGTRRAQVDLVAVGPGGVFIVDTKAWRDVRIEQGRIFRGDLDATEDLAALEALADLARLELAEEGLPAGEVHVVVVLAGRHGVDLPVGPVRVVGEGDVRRRLASYGRRLGDEQLALVLEGARRLFVEISPPCEPAVQIAAVPTPDTDVGTSGTAPPATATTGLVAAGQDTLFDEGDVVSDLIASRLAGPLEEWMAFLHPAQARLVARSFRGPCRIRGAAGTGKTVVGLHRAAHLARRRDGRVLMTTFVRTLPDVLSHLVRSLAPDVADRIEFAGVHQWALSLLKRRGVGVRLDAGAADEAMRSAYRRRGGPLVQLGRTERYWRDEVELVIKGRGLPDFTVYQELTRTGRRWPLSPEQRRDVWALYEAYEEELARRQVHDFADVVLAAEAELRREPEPYAAVVVDEAQDLTCAMVRMLHATVGDRSDGLTLIGDGQQAIYPGGYTLSEAGVSVAGRAVVLGVNYRNTVEILRFATPLVGRTELVDIETGAASADGWETIVRSGRNPVLARYERSPPPGSLCAR